jgi:hypothetical protein
VIVQAQPRKNVDGLGELCFFGSFGSFGSSLCLAFWSLR